MAEFTEGQEVLHVTTGDRYDLAYDARRRRRITPVRIVKIGRTLAHVDHGYGRLETYRLDTGRSVKDFGGRIITQEELDAEDARADAATRLREEYGWYRQGGKKLPEDAILRVLALMDEMAGVDQ